MPVVCPTVPKAETVSNAIWMKVPCAPVTSRASAPAKTIATARSATDRARATTSAVTRRPNASVNGSAADRRDDREQQDREGRDLDAARRGPRRAADEHQRDDGDQRRVGQLADRDRAHAGRPERDGLEQGVERALGSAAARRASRGWTTRRRGAPSCPRAAAPRSSRGRAWSRGPCGPSGACPARRRRSRPPGRRGRSGRRGGRRRTGRRRTR